MNLSDVEIMPYPNAVFYLTGASVITLLYVTFYSSVNKIPEVIGEKVTSVTGSMTSFGDAVNKTAKDLYSIIPSTNGAKPVPSQEKLPENGIMSNISNSLSKLNPFTSSTAQAPAPAPGPAPEPQMKGGSRKKNKKRTKKTRRSKK
jgi:hypothetical protein